MIRRCFGSRLVIRRCFLNASRSYGPHRPPPQLTVSPPGRQSALASLRQERVRVEHLMANLPGRLPNMIAQQQQQGVAAQQQQAAAAAATNGSRTGEHGDMVVVVERIRMFYVC